jgi:hypothetical protein
MFWIGLLTGFATGFVFCVFLSLTVVFYQRIKGKKDVNFN